MTLRHFATFTAVTIASAAPAFSTTSTSDFGDGAYIGVVIVAALVYFSPVLIAFSRQHRFRWLILVICIAGWPSDDIWPAAVVWAAAFTWAVWPNQRRVAKEASSTRNGDILADGRFEQLERLGRLRVCSAITAEEFQTEKDRILRR